MKNHSHSPIEMAASLFRNRHLILALVEREVLGRYQGSILGVAWSLVNPVFMLAVYTFVFSTIFKARWSTGSDSKTEFALILFAGLIVFNLFSECISRAPGIIVGNTNYVKKVVFPLEILPVVSLGAALFHALVSLVVWLIAYIIIFGAPDPRIMWAPIVFLPLILFSLGVSWLLASCGVFLRDMPQLIAMFTGVLMFMSPIFYPVSALPVQFQPILKLNPLTPVIEQMRDILYWHKNIVAAEWAMNFFVSLTVAWIGFIWFQRTRKGFADVL